MPAPCPLCGRPCPRRLRARGHDIFRCAACDFEFVAPVPPPETLRGVYAQGYFTGGGLGYTDYFGLERAVTDDKARARAEVLVGLGLRAGSNVLDIGCADGRFLLELRARGIEARGVEISAEARAALPRDIAASIDDSLEQAARHGPYAAVTLWDTLEHLPSPLETLRSVRTMLKEGGLVGALVPVIDNVNARLAPRTWDQYKPPEHLWFFSRRSLRATLERELDARVVYEACAWSRDARWSAVARPVGRALGSALRALEGGIWRTLRTARLIPGTWLEDSVLMVAEVAAR